ncbi:unnamed protein product [Vicia faba]|uniref:Uncharacterized protein n=1 Tax=Vicia faba TaxID=3906 RepID=A0AAV1B4V3_VICFA|nr:unnamed protein product [Vicia faba]
MPSFKYKTQVETEPYTSIHLHVHHAINHVQRLQNHVNQPAKTSTTPAFIKCTIQNNNIIIMINNSTYNTAMSSSKSCSNIRKTIRQDRKQTSSTLPPQSLDSPLNPSQPQDHLSHAPLSAPLTTSFRFLTKLSFTSRSFS